jgi:ubiquinone/menaquinone biosynthesis C-methylase UbiE
MCYDVQDFRLSQGFLFMSLAASPHLTPEQLMQFMWGFAPPLMLEAALKNRVFEVLSEGPKTLEELSIATDASVRGLGTICNALISFELLTKDHKERYLLTPLSAGLLTRDKHEDQGGLLRHISEQMLPKWLQMNENVRIGRPALAEEQTGEDSTFFEQFVEDLFPLSYQAACTLVQSLRLHEPQAPVRVLDLATGSSVWSVTLAEASSCVQATVIDWAGVLPVTKRIIAQRGLSRRFTFIEGDVLAAPYGHGYDIATLGHILHGGSRTRSRVIIEKTFRALAPGGTITISEMSNANYIDTSQRAIMAENRIHGAKPGDAYTFSEISVWLKQAGFGEPRVLTSPIHPSLILSTKPF